MTCDTDSPVSVQGMWNTSPVQETRPMKNVWAISWVICGPVLLFRAYFADWWVSLSSLDDTSTSQTITAHINGFLRRSEREINVYESEALVSLIYPNILMHSKLLEQSPAPCQIKGMRNPGQRSWGWHALKIADIFKQIILFKSITVQYFVYENSFQNICWGYLLRVQSGYVCNQWDKTM